VIRNRTLFFSPTMKASACGNRSQIRSRSLRIPCDRKLPGLPVANDPTIPRRASASLSGNRIPVTSLDSVSTACLVNIPTPTCLESPRTSTPREAAINRQQFQCEAGSPVSTTTQPTCAFRCSTTQFDRLDREYAGELCLLRRNLTPCFDAWPAGPTSSRPISDEARFAFLTVAAGAAESGIRFGPSGPAGLRQTRRRGFAGVLGGQFTTMAIRRCSRFATTAISNSSITSTFTGVHNIKFGAYLMHYDFRPVNPNGARACCPNVTQTE